MTIQKSSRARISSRKTVGFRLSEQDQKLLEKRASELNLNPNTLARMWVIGALKPRSDCEGDKAVADLRPLLVKLAELRGDLLFAVQALLVGAGRKSAAEAEAWIKKNF